MKFALRIAPWVLLVLASGWLYIVLPMIEQHRASVILMHLRQIDTMLFAYVIDHQSYPKSLDELLGQMNKEDLDRIKNEDWFKSMKYFPPQSLQPPDYDRIVILVPFYEGALVVNKGNQRYYIKKSANHIMDPTR